MDAADNEHFLTLVEDYFAQPTEAKMADVRPELAYQVGQGGELRVGGRGVVLSALACPVAGGRGRVEQ